MRLTQIFAPALGCFVFVVGVALAAQTQPILPINELFAASPTLQITTQTPIVTTTVAARKTPVPTNPAAKPVKATCIITVNGKRYDVQPLRKTHSGGNIFVCDTTMTKTFNQQHGTNYGLIAKYRI